jgi:hypothetical protein
MYRLRLLLRNLFLSPFSIYSCLPNGTNSELIQNFAHFVKNSKNNCVTYVTCDTFVTQTCLERDSQPYEQSSLPRISRTCPYQTVLVSRLDYNQPIFVQLLSCTIASCTFAIVHYIAARFMAVYPLYVRKYI